MKLPAAIAVVALGASALAGCSSSGSTPAATPAATPAPVQEVTIVYDETAQFEISAGGPTIFIDVWDASGLTHTPAADDILLTTHGHPDHFDAGFEASFPGRKITYEATTLQAEGISIVSLAAAHSEGLELMEKGGSDYIFVIDIAGLRIAHFGDLGQEKLTDDQMAALGDVDVAMSQLANSYSAMSAENRLGFNQMNQVKPRLFIPTHFDSAAAEIATQEWKATWSAGPVTISRDDLPAETTCLFMGMQATGYGALYSLPPFEG